MEDHSPLVGTPVRCQVCERKGTYRTSHTSHPRTSAETKTNRIAEAHDPRPRGDRRGAPGLEGFRAAVGRLLQPRDAGIRVVRLEKTHMSHHLLSGWPKKSPNFRFATKVVLPKS